MSRYLVELPESYIYRTHYKVVYSDINAANHLGADRVLPIALEAQFGFIRSLGYDDAVVFENAGLIMANSQIDHLSETHYGDELVIDLGTAIASGKSMDFIYRIRNRQRGAEVARVKTRLLFFNYSEKKVTDIPQNFLAKLESVQTLKD